ncbi:MAG: RNA 2',3'-cyclic phosphodiesterase [Atopobiaceae bacterium]|nr:RNA 2',3'-cyclic phosphodiesterase [Atopobiaceae bacterium]MDO4403481.1 RNA 2',3'-cyclic phosphodiesterase [Atopobiaceae bacterium]
MRLFVATELSEPLFEALCETSCSLRDCVRGRFVAPDSFHVTLAFLGEVPQAQVVLAQEALDEACELQPPIEVALGALGSFGRPRKSTLWQGFARGVDELGGLAGDVREALLTRGLTYDSAAFVPHVTLMRAADVTSGLLPMPTVAKGSIDTVTLFRSDLSGERPRYEPLHRVRLQPLDPEEEQR